MAAAGLAAGLALAPRLQWPAPSGQVAGAMTRLGLDARGPLRETVVCLLLAFLFAWLGAIVFRRADSRAERLLLGILVTAGTVAGALYGSREHPWSAVAVALIAAAIAAMRPRWRDTALIPIALALFFLLLPLAPRHPQWALLLACAITAALRFWRPVRIPAAGYAMLVFVYPLFLLGLRSAPHADFYEDGHDFAVAAEMSRGEAPYRDIVPLHGLASDGGISFLAMETIGGDAGTLLTARRVIGALNLVAIFCLAFAATGIAEAGFLAALLGVMLFPPETIFVRTIPSLFALACGAAGVRLRSRRWWIAAGALGAIAPLFGLEFAAYTLGALGLMALRVRAWRPLGAGLLAGGIPSALFLIAGSHGAAFKAIFREVFDRAAYVIGPLDLHAPELWLWGAIAIVTCGGLTRKGTRGDALWLIGSWSALAIVSYAERRHLFFLFVASAFVVVAATRLPRGFAPAFAIAVTVAARPAAHLFDVAVPLRLSHGVPAGSDVPLSGLPRARGALFAPELVAPIGSAHRFMTTLAPDATFFDFTNSATLYYLFDRDCPIRFFELPMAESRAAQEKVIAAIERNPRVRAALVEFPGHWNAIDGVPNRERAPLVWQYLQQRFTPAFSENGVVFLVRK